MGEKAFGKRRACAGLKGRPVNECLSCRLAGMISGKHTETNSGLSRGAASLPALVRWAIIIAWVMSTFWLVRYEAFPQMFSGTLRGYRHVLPSDVLVRDSWMKIKLNEEPVGYSHYNVQTVEAGNQTFYTITNTLVLGLRIMGKERRIEMNNAARVDLSHRLRSFRSSITSATLSASLSGEQVKNSLYNVSLFYNGRREEHEITIPKDTVVFSPLAGLNIGSLESGRKAVLKIFDPLTMSPARVTLEARGTREVELDETLYNARAIDVQYRDISMTVLVDEESGELLKQVTPFGLTMEKAGPDEAFLAATNASPGIDLIEILGGQTLKGLSPVD
jgi:hypothetical protein